MKTILFKALFFLFRASPRAGLPEPVDRILVIRQDNRIGNLILITPLLALIKQRWPGAQLDVIVGGSFGSVLSNNPDLHQIRTYDQLRFIRMPWRFFFFLRSLRKARYDIVFDLKSVFSFNNMMLTVMSGAQYRVGFKNAISRGFFNREVEHPDPDTYDAQYLAALLKPFMAFDAVPAIRYLPPTESIVQAKKELENAGVTSTRPIGIHTGGRGQKKMSLQRFLALGGFLREQSVPVLFFFGPDEKGERALFEDKGFICFAPATVAEFGGYLPHLRLFISCDTGPMHMAAGAGVATLSFFSATSCGRFGPKEAQNRCVVINETTDIATLALNVLKETA